jgi:hypothetical protein
MPGQVQVYPHLSQAILFPIGLVDVYLLCINSNLNVMIRQELVPLSKLLHKYMKKCQTLDYRRAAFHNQLEDNGAHYPTGMTIISFDREEASHHG